MKKAFYWLIGIAATPFILFALLTVLLYLPPVQRWAVGIATQYASKKTGMDISIQDVRMRFPIDIQLDGFRALHTNDSLPQRKDTIIDAHHAICEIQLRPLFQKEVKVDILQLDSVRLNTNGFISDCRVKGNVGRLMLTGNDINLTHDSLLVNRAFLSNANLDICLSDTAKEDTTKTHLPWVFVVNDLKVQNTQFCVHMPGDTLRVRGQLTDLAMHDALMDMRHTTYRIAHTDLKNSTLNYDNRFEPMLNGLDYNHLALSKINIGIDTLTYRQQDLSDGGTSYDLAMHLRACNMQEKSGLTLSSLTTSLALDTASVHLTDLDLRTPYSSVKGAIDMDFNAFAEKDPGQLKADVDASIGKTDIMIIAGQMIPKNFRKLIPERPMTVRGVISGNMRRCLLDHLTLNIPTLLYGRLTATVWNLDDIDRLRLSSKLDIYAAGNNGHIRGTANYAMATEAYKADLSVNRLNINKYFPGYGLQRFSGYVKVNGQGTDIYSRRTRITADARITAFRYSKYNLSGSRAHLVLRNGVANANIHTAASIMKTDLNLQAKMSKRAINATIGGTIDNLDLYALHITDVPLRLQLKAGAKIYTDLRNNLSVKGKISSLTMVDSANVYHPDDMTIDILARKDTTHADIDCGDFCLRADFSQGYKRILSLTSTLSKEVQRQIDNKIIDETAFRRKLPNGRLFFTSGQENPVARCAKSLGYDFSSAVADITTSPVGGINGTVTIDTLRTNDMQLDNISLKLTSTADKMSYTLDIENGKDNPQYCFHANAVGTLNLNGTTLALRLDDEDNKRIADVALSAVMENDTTKIHIDGDKAIFGYREFSVNSDNYLSFSSDLRASARIRLVADDGTGVQIYTDDENREAMQDFTVSIHQLDIANIISALPYMPKITGIADGDFHVIVAENSTSVSSDIDFKQLTYEDCLMGNISTEFVYIPREDGTHYVDGILMKDGEQVGTLVGTYQSVGDHGNIDADLTLDDMPMDLVNGFIPDQVMGMTGTGDGTLHITGTLPKCDVNGEIDLSQARLISIPYGVSLVIDQNPLVVSNSRILFRNFCFYDSNNQPITCNGNVDFSNTDHITTNLSLRGENILFINAKETRQSEAYGKAYVNFYAMVTGELDRLRVQAKLDVLPSTNLYYILRDSPITTDNRLKELVTFTDFSQTNTTTQSLPTVDGMTVDMNISVREGSHLICWMNGNHSNYLDIYGSGDLRMLYTADDIQLTGRYTISSGEMKYSLPVIPLKTFSISQDSYIEFTGDMMNPRLNITATEKNRASTNINGTNRAVDFTCGVVISKTLQDMGLQFIISAPEDQEVSDQLNMLSVEDRGKLAVTMLTTGMYLAESNTSNFTMNSALSSFLQQEINNIAGSALKTLDLSIGMENNTLADGTMSMDYSFKFAKRFWNNRISVSIGGKISTGEQASGKSASIFDNVEVQYRMSDTSNQYLRLFYKHDVYDYLEGYLDHYGVGYLYKRKLQSLGELFGRQSTVAPVRTDSLTEPKDSIHNE